MLAMTSFAPAKCRGFTLIELMVVLTLLAVIAGLAAPGFRSTIARQKLSTAANDLLSSALQARSEAIKANQQTIVQPVVSTDWAQGWRVYVDVDKDKAYTEGTDTFVTSVPPVADSVTVVDTEFFNSSVGNLIAFDPNGFLLSQNAGRVVFASTVIPSSELKKGVIVSRTGRARICTSQPGKDGCAATSAKD